MRSLGLTTQTSARFKPLGYFVFDFSDRVSRAGHLDSKIGRSHPVTLNLSGLFYPLTTNKSYVGSPHSIRVLAKQKTSFGRTYNTQSMSSNMIVEGRS